MKLNVFFILILLLGCSYKSKDINTSTCDSIGAWCFEHCNVIAKTDIRIRYRDNIRDTVTVCDLSLVEKKEYIPLNLLIDTFNVIVFDDLLKEDYDSSFIPVFRFSNNYIYMYSNMEKPLKLFDRKGNYIRDIGRIGDNLGEYLTIDDIFVDERSDNIFILPYGGASILNYNFSGKYNRDIPLVHKNTAGSFFHVDTRSEEVLMLTPFDDKTEHCIWIQDFEGQRLQSIAPYTYYRNISYSGDKAIVSSCMQEIAYFHHRVNNGTDFLYHFLENGNRLAPKFRMKNAKDSICYSVYELPKYFILEVDKITAENENLSYQKIILDKKTLRGCSFDGFLSNFGVMFGNRNSVLLNTLFDGYFSEYYFLSEMKLLWSKSSIESLYDFCETNLSMDSLKNNNNDCLFLFMGKLNFE